jgi:BirA family biotin operon repressor/biotin-[acetyl-CoA-carboxylase] ligase
MKAESGLELSGTIFAGKLQRLASVDSTNTALMRAAAQGADIGTVYLADEQTGGRGRGSHSWHSQPGEGIYLSALIRPNIAPRDVLWLSLLSGLAVQAAIAQVAAIHPDLRWPNDVMLGPKKMGGILTEVNADSTRVNYAVIGIGLNVNQPSFPADVVATATSLLIETGHKWPREEIVAAILRQLNHELANINPASLARTFEASSSYARGASVHVDEGSGYDGTTVGLDEHGLLRVKAGCNIRTVVNGGVRKLG